MLRMLPGSSRIMQTCLRVQKRWQSRLATGLPQSQMFLEMKVCKRSHISWGTIKHMPVKFVLTDSFTESPRSFIWQEISRRCGVAAVADRRPWRGAAAGVPTVRQVQTLEKKRNAAGQVGNVFKVQSGRQVSLFFIISILHWHTNLYIYILTCRYMN